MLHLAHHPISTTTRPSYRAATIACVGLAALGILAAPAIAQDYLITISGPYRTFANEGFSFDGTTNGTLDPIYNIQRLTGGTFSATFRFQAVTSPAPGDFAGYDFTPPAGLTYDLFDSAGALVHRGTSPSNAGATVTNNFSFNGNPPSDSVSMFSFVRNVTGLVTPAPLYGPGEVGAIQSSIGFGGVVSPGNDYLTDLSIPLSASTYLSFPNRTFRTAAYFGDGDFFDFLDPYQYIETSVTYGITSVNVTQVPAPGAASVLGLGGLLAARRRRR
ncbi:MAG: hypothetical protein K2W85_01415 [Phycisphaerales bacterium]|nr:hypothetical protein [Phycisphaerales bacterium]